MHTEIPNCISFCSLHNILCIKVNGWSEIAKYCRLYHILCFTSF